MKKWKCGMSIIPNGFINQILTDLDRIDKVIKEGTHQEQLRLHRELDARYQACIKDWYFGFRGTIYSKTMSVACLKYSYIEDSPSEVVENLEMMRTKIETYQYQVNAIHPVPSNQPTTQINVTTNVSVNITFQKARSEVKEMSSLTDEQTQEVLERIDEIEQVINTDTSKKTKWEKIKPVLVWLADKSYDLGKIILPLLLKIQD